MEDHLLTTEEANNLNIHYYQRRLLMVWTVTQNPSDYPGKFVARPFVIQPDSVKPLHTALVADTLNDLHTMMPPALVRMSRDQNDDAVIVEVWV